MVNRRSIFVFGWMVILLTSSCGIFKKDCGCPHLGKAKAQPKPTPTVYAAR